MFGFPVSVTEVVSEHRTDIRDGSYAHICREPGRGGPGEISWVSGKHKVDNLPWRRRRGDDPTDNRRSGGGKGQSVSGYVGISTHKATSGLPVLEICDEEDTESSGMSITASVGDGGGW